jgi:hypothetical protein
MDFWTLLAIALAVLWAQANVIFCFGLHALRTEARVRWEALLSMERRLMECQRLADGGFSHELTRWNALLEASILPENGAKVIEFYEVRRSQHALNALGGFAVLVLRCEQANLCYSEAAARYNSRINGPLGWPLSRWMGFEPVEEPPEPAVALGALKSGDPGRAC